MSVTEVFLSKVGAEWNLAFNVEREAKREEFFRRAKSAKDERAYAYWAFRAASLSRKGK